MIDTSASRPAAKIIFLADLHMLPPGQRIIGIDPAVRLRSAVRDIRDRHGDAALVVVLGDVTHRGDAQSCLRARRILDGLGLPVRVMAGNHDDRAALRAAFPDTPADRDGFLQSETTAGGYRLLLLDSRLDPPHDLVSDSCGRLCARRLAWLDARLGEAKARGEPVLLFVHHPPFPTGFPGMDLIRLADADALHGLAIRHGNVRHIFAGHVHRTIGGAWRGIPVSVFKSPVHQQPMDLATVSGGLSVDEPGAYGIVLLYPDAVIVHTEDYDVAARNRRRAARVSPIAQSARS